jgi:hypothetical protein
MDVSAEVTNTLPVGIKAGAVVVFRNVANGSLVMTRTIDEPIASGASVDFTETIQPAEVGGQLRVHFENIQTESTQDLTDVTTQMGIQATVALDFEGVARVRYKADQTFTHADTVEYELGFGDLQEVDPNGKFTVKLENYFPVEGGIQLYFLPKSKAYVLDSLFLGPNDFAAPEIDGEGFAKQAVNTLLEAPVDAERLEKIRPAKYIVVRSTAHSPQTPEILTAERENYIDLRIIADLNVTVQ